MSDETRAGKALAEFEDRARKARDSWLKTMLAGKKVEDDVKRLLKEQLDKVIFETLGLRKGWGGDIEWELHRTNGRKPPLYNALVERAEEAAIKLVMDVLKTPPTLTKGQRDAIRKAYVDQLAYRARDLAAEEGARHANEVLDRVLDELDESGMEFCPRCQVKHLEPLHDQMENAS